jgi:hypothetical protein
MSDKIEEKPSDLDEIYVHLQSPDEARLMREVLILASRRYPDSIAVKRWQQVLELELTKRRML